MTLQSKTVTNVKQAVPFFGVAAVMLQEFWKDGQHSGRPEGKLGQGVSICFTCEDALAIYREFKSRGVDAKRPLRRQRDVGHFRVGSRRVRAVFREPHRRARRDRSLRSGGVSAGKLYYLGDLLG